MSIAGFKIGVGGTVNRYNYPNLDNPPTIPENVIQYVAQTLTDAQKQQARDNIGAASIDDLGTVFNIKGDVAAVADLPASGNRVGDVYYVQAVSAAYVWLVTTAEPNGYWEEFGEPIDLSGYIEAPSSPVLGYYLHFNGTTWVAAAAPVTSVNGMTGAVTLDAEDVGAMPEPFGTPQHDDIIAYDGVHNRWTVTSLNVWTGGSY